MTIRHYDIVNCSQRRTKLEMLQARYSVGYFKRSSEPDA